MVNELFDITFGSSPGRHYWYDISADMNCDDFYPMFLLYNSGHLTGFGWVAQGNAASPRYEHPPPKKLGVSMTRAVTYLCCVCVLVCVSACRCVKVWVCGCGLRLYQCLSCIWAGLANKGPNLQVILRNEIPKQSQAFYAVTASFSSESGVNFGEPSHGPKYPRMGLEV